MILAYFHSFEHVVLRGGGAPHYEKSPRNVLYTIQHTPQGCSGKSCVRSYLKGTKVQGCNLFMYVKTYLRDCGAGVQPVYAVSEPAFRELWGKDAVWLSGGKTYLSGTVCRGVACLNGVRTYLPGLEAGVYPVCAMSVRTC